MKSENTFFQYPYDRVFDYYVIQAWRDQPKRPPAYTPQMVRHHTRLLGELPWVSPTRSGDQNMVIGQTPGWPENPDFPDDPAIPPQDIHAYQIGEASPQQASLKMLVAAGNHSTEFTGNWVLEGMADFLAGDDERADALRQRMFFLFYPDVNPEGRYMAVRNLTLQAAPDPEAGTNMRYRGNPPVYARGESDNNRIWNTNGTYSHIDTIKNAMKKDIGGSLHYLWDLHGPQDRANWRSPQGRSAWDSPYGRALQEREPDVLIAGLPDGFKSGLSFDPGKLSVWALVHDGLDTDYSYVYEPGGWTEKRLKEAGRNIALALFDIMEP